VRFTVLSLAFSTLLACGKQGVKPANEDPTTPPAPSTAAAERDGPLTPVAEPPGLVLVARATRDGVRDLGLLGPPEPVLTPSRFVDGTRAIEDLIDANGSYEFAWVVDGPEAILSRQFTAVVSIPLTSWNDSRSRMLSLRRESDDEITRGTDGTIISEGTWGGCVLGRALGPSPARIVCAGTRAAAERLSHYALRGLPTRDFGTGSAVIELYPSRAVKGQEDKYQRIVQMVAPLVTRGAPSSDRALLEPMLETLLPESVDAISDLERVRFALEQQNGDVVITGSVEVVGARSWTSRMLSGIASQPDARELFRRLPQTSGLAWFNSSSRPERMDEARKTLATWIRNYMGAGYQRDTADLVANTFIARAPMVYAQGDLVDADASIGEGAKRIYEKTLSTYGWHLVGFREKASAYEPELDRGMRAYNNGDLNKFAYRELDSLCPGLTKITRRPALGGLPKGSVLYEMRLPPKFFDDCAQRWTRIKAKPSTNSLGLNVILVPDGEITWIGFSADEKILRKQLASVLGKKDTLAGDSSLALLDGGDAKLGGFISLAGLGGLQRFLTMNDHAIWSRSRLAARPHKGKTRMPFRIDVAVKGERTTLSLSARMPRALVEDMRPTTSTTP
jgi:hypothetical protein